jgi:hypothetical protein
VLAAPRLAALLDRAKGRGHLLIRVCCARCNEKQECWRKPVPKLLSEDEVAAYRDRGYHFPIDALSAGEVADFRRKLEDYEAGSGGPITGEMRHRSHVLFHGSEPNRSDDRRIGLATSRPT